MIETECTTKQNIYNKARTHSSSSSSDSKQCERLYTQKAGERARYNDPSSTKPKPLFETESSVYLRLVDVVITSCKQHKKASVCSSPLAVVVIHRTLCCAYKFYFHTHTQQIRLLMLLACLYPMWNFDISSIALKILNSFWCWFIDTFFVCAVCVLPCMCFQWLNDDNGCCQKNIHAYSNQQIHKKNDDESTWQNWVYALLNTIEKKKKNI